MAGPVVLNVKQANVVFADTQAGLASGTDYTCQVTSAQIKANPKLQTVAATFCAAESQSPAASGWQLDLTWLQDWGAPTVVGPPPTGSLSQYMFDNDAELKWFKIVPTDPAAPGAEGQCYVVAGEYLGAAGAPLTATATCPCPVKPTIAATITLAAPTEASAESEPDYATA